MLKTAPAKLGTGTLLLNWSISAVMMIRPISDDDDNNDYVNDSTVTHYALL